MKDLFVVCMLKYTKLIIGLFTSCNMYTLNMSCVAQSNEVVMYLRYFSGKSRYAIGSEKYTV